MVFATPLRVSVMFSMPPCASLYTSHGLSSTGTPKKPSPPDTLYQSAGRMPCPDSELLGPHQVPLSCRPPHTRYGTCMS